MKYLIILGDGMADWAVPSFDDCSSPRPSHTLRARTHTAEPVYYPGIESDGVQTFDEVSCQQGAYGLLEKDEFIKHFISLS
jgi:2,3-bisphosphoglycerate-independent phosphoglycerate mutase